MRVTSNWAFKVIRLAFTCLLINSAVNPKQYCMCVYISTDNDNISIFLICIIFIGMHLMLFSCHPILGLGLKY